MSPTHRHEDLVRIATIRHAHRVVRRQRGGRRDGIAKTWPVAPRLRLHCLTVSALIAGAIPHDGGGAAVPVMAAGAIGAASWRTGGPAGVENGGGARGDS